VEGTKWWEGKEEGAGVGGEKMGGGGGENVVKKGMG